MRKIILLFAMVMVLFVSGFAQGELNYIFKSGTDGYHTFRIPAIVTTSKGTLLAFAEGRKNSWSDSGDIDLVYRRSDDGGKTWSDITVVWSDGTNCCGNPAPVVDVKTGRIFLFSTWNLGTDHEYGIIDGKSKDGRHVYYLNSDDDGKTWCAPVEVTTDVKLPDWTWYATGPVHGIQLTKGEFKGRLMIACDHIEKDSKKYYSHVFYSDNHGKTWKLGGTIPGDKVNECTVAELSNGDLMLNMRSYDRSVKARKVSVSKDGGDSWGKLVADSVLVDPICQGSLYRYSFGKGQKNRLLFLNAGSVSKREKMTLRLSYDDGKTWAKSMVLFPVLAAYSDLTRLKNGDVGCLYEAGYKDIAEGIVFGVVKIKDLEK